MNTRTFAAKPAVRESVPLLIGLMGPSGSGKTFSALRLATGIQSIVGGEIFGIDTEARRMLHYSDRFKFQHVQFDPPFGSDDYLQILKFCAAFPSAKVIIVDSMSHEHEGPGGMLDYHEQELDRLAGDDYRRREAMKMLAWQKPKAARRTLINGLLQMNCNFVFCFRAHETVRPVKVDGKTVIQPQGFMPVAGKEFAFEQTVNILLLPKSGGVPTWQSDQAGERLMMKLPAQFEGLFSERKPLDESIGAELAKWAQGNSGAVSHPAPNAAAAAGQPAETKTAAAANPIDEADRKLAEAAQEGMVALGQAWKELTKEQKGVLKYKLERDYKRIASNTDAERLAENAETGSYI